MKKKLLFFIITIASMFAMLAITSSAKEWFGSVEIIDIDQNGVSDIAINDKLPSVVNKGTVDEKGDLIPASEDARVKLACGCAAGSHTFPAYYISTKQTGQRFYLFDFSTINELLPQHCQSAITISVDDILAFEIPNGYTAIYSGFLYEGSTMSAQALEYFSFATCSTLTAMEETSTARNWFQYAPKLKEVDIGKYIGNIAKQTFYYCGALEKVNIPKDSNLTVFYEIAFAGCTSLEAFYIPPKVTNIVGGGTNNGVFCGCSSLYFINEPDETEKPSVYYFPSTLKSVSGENFKNTTSMNATVVFPETVTELTQGWEFNGSSVQNIVFLGDMTTYKYVNNAVAYFANPNDLSTDNVSINKVGGSSTMIFCNATSNTSHLVSPRNTVTIPATCSSYAEYQNKCFCGADMDKTYGTEYDLNNHDYEDTDVVSITYTKFNENGTKSVKCGYGCNVNGTKTAEPIFKTLGYSIKNSGYGIAAGYDVNKTALDEYETIMGDIKFGIIIANATTFGDSFMVDGVLSNNFGIQLEVTSTDYSRINSIVTDFTSDEKDLKLVMALYVIDDGDVSYVQHTGSYEGTVEKGDTALDVVTISKIATLTNTTLPFVTPTPAPTGDEENA